MANHRWPAPDSALTRRSRSSAVWAHGNESLPSLAMISCAPFSTSFTGTFPMQTAPPEWMHAGPSSCRTPRSSRRQLGRTVWTGNSSHSSSKPPRACWCSSTSSRRFSRIAASAPPARRIGKGRSLWCSMAWRIWFITLTGAGPLSSPCVRTSSSAAACLRTSGPCWKRSISACRWMNCTRRAGGKPSRDRRHGLEPTLKRGWSRPC